MATERQIEANRKNAALSTGPKTDAGKAASRLNATQHGMASQSPASESYQTPEFQARRAGWLENFQPSTDFENWSLDRMVAASFQIDRCERALEGLSESTVERAQLAWEQDRALDAAKLGSKLAKNPALIVRELESTWHGVALMIQWWNFLGEALKNGEDWTDAQASIALDLLGVPTHFRTGRTRIDGPSNSRAFHANLVTEEVERLEELHRKVLVRIDVMDRGMAVTGDSLMLNPSAKLILRYEREAWRRLRESMKVLTAPTPAPEAIAAPAPAPAPTRRPPVEPDDRSIHEMMIREARAGLIRDLGLEESSEELEEYLAQLDLNGTNPISAEAGMSRTTALFAD